MIFCMENVNVCVVQIFEINVNCVVKSVSVIFLELDNLI